MSRLAAVPALLALGLASSAFLTACTGSDAAPPGGGRGIDARAYYDDYESAELDGGALNYSSSQPSAPAEDGGGAPLPPEVPDGPDVPPVPEPDEDNRFVDAGTSGFVTAADDPRSTFGLDVDPGSFNLARSSLRQGYPVPAASIRPEEWVNALAYDDPAPTGAALGLTTDGGVAPSLDDGTQVVRVGVTAREVAPEDRPRVNVTLVVDRSGSMDIRERLGLVQSSLALLADRLDDDDTVSVVTFEDTAEPLLRPTPVRNTQKILDAVEDLTPGGSTNLAEGLEVGYEQARDAFDPNAVNLVVLCSDGVANVGATGPGTISDRIAEEGADGIHLVTVGYGLGNYDDHLMEQLANLGDGFYSYVDTYAEAEQLFGRDLVTTLVPVAGEARAQVAFDPERVTSYRLLGYENRAIADEDFEDLDVDAGELGSGHHATALYEVRLADGARPGDVIGTASLRWRDLPSGEAAAAEADLLAADPAAAPSPAWELAVTAADAAQLLKGAAPFAGRGTTLDDLQDRAHRLDDAGVGGAADLVEVLDLAAEVD